jgi:hypothetical protein
MKDFHWLLERSLQRLDFIVRKQSHFLKSALHGVKSGVIHVKYHPTHFPIMRESVTPPAFPLEPPLKVTSRLLPSSLKSYDSCDNAKGVSAYKTFSISPDNSSNSSGRSTSGSFKEQLQETFQYIVNTYSEESLVISKMAWKVSLATLCRTLLPAITTAFLGHLGSQELAAFALANIWVSGLQTVIYGFSVSLCTVRKIHFLLLFSYKHPHSFVVKHSERKITNWSAFGSNLVLLPCLPLEFQSAYPFTT